MYYLSTALALFILPLADSDPASAASVKRSCKVDPCHSVQSLGFSVKSEENAYNRVLNLGQQLEVCLYCSQRGDHSLYGVI